MRCQSCDKGLSDFESTRKSAVTGEYFDLCNHCFSTIREELQYKERYDLINVSDLDEEEEDNETFLDKM